MEPFHGGGVEFGFFLGNDVFSFQAVDFAADFRQLAESDFPPCHMTLPRTSTRLRFMSLIGTIVIFFSTTIFSFSV